MSSHSSWDEVKGTRRQPTADARAAIERELAPDEKAHVLRAQDDGANRPTEAREP